MYKGVGYINEKDLKELFGLPDECTVTGVTHDQRTGKIELVLHSSVKIEGLTHEIKENDSYRISSLYNKGKKVRDDLIQKIVELDNKLLEERVSNANMFISIYNPQQEKFNANEFLNSIKTEVKKLGGNI
ncbi:hypothetical protein WKH57_01575 [Niallia taxi]|uniref:hypothetical protein n=1 Tax=Niallia taxi TaxID=2499688 RepID=UPI00316E6E36